MGLFNNKYKSEAAYLSEQLQGAHDENAKLRAKIISLNNEVSKLNTDFNNEKNELLKKIKCYKEENSNLSSLYKNALEENQQLSNILNNDWEEITYDEDDIETGFENEDNNKKEYNHFSRSFSHMLPIIEQETSLQNRIKRLNNYINGKKPKKILLDKAKKIYDNCQKGAIGEELVYQCLTDIKHLIPKEAKSVILRDLCFKSSFDEKSHDRKDIQIDFVMITSYAIFILDSKYRTSTDNINDEKAEALKNAKDEIFNIIKLSGFDKLNEDIFYSMLVYSGKEEVNHAGFNVKCSDSHSGFYEKNSNIKYVFLDNLKNDILGIYSLNGRLCGKSDDRSFDSKEIEELSYILEEYVVNNQVDFNSRCPICNQHLKRKNNYSGIMFLGCSSFPQCDYTESII